jgi:Zn-dependent protease with chaperone function
MTKGSGIYFDGITSARREVTVELAPETLVIFDSRGDELAEWLYGDIEQLSAPKSILRMGLRGEAVVLARLEVHDPDFAAAVDDRALTVDRTGATDRRARNRVIAWSLVATASLVFVAVFVAPQLAGRLAPLVPASLETRLGAAVDAQVRTMLDTRKLGDRLVCGTQEGERAGKEALDAIAARLSQAAAPLVPLQMAVVRRSEANAIALPGGRIYVFQGLLDKAENPDELIGVIAHEVGHVVNRDGTRSTLQGAGLSLMFGMLLGDFVGGGAVVIAARALIQSSYSREVELAADAFGGRLMAQLGRDPKALGAILTRIDGDSKPGGRIWLDHPGVQDRVRALNTIAPAKTGAPLLDAGQWAALKQICSDL